jgi:signal transduction histidine kinase
MGKDAVSNFDERQMLGRLLHIQGEVQGLDRQLQRANRLMSLGTLTGIIAHELNNILTPILSYSQLALKDPQDEALVSKALERAVEGSQHASEIVAAILGFVRETKENHSTRVADVVNDALRCLARDPKKDGLEFICEIEGEIAVAMPPVLLVQVLVNLILNAQQAMTRGRGRLRLRSWRQDEDTACITVADNGCGIEPELMERIFEPFVSYRNRPSDDVGTGLGLTVCKQAVEEVGGRISVESTVGRGTTFTLQLPAVDLPAETDAAEPQRDVA